jgi:predicted hydrolase (HD superfamily)
MNNQSALALLHEYTKSESLRNHALKVEAAMRWYAQHFGKSEAEIEEWGICGLLHDFDYEQFPEPVAPNGHPFRGNQILTELGVSQEIRDAIMGHALYSGVPRITHMAKTLFAVDELCGLIVACSLVRPDKSLQNVKVSSVKKKFKDKAFARGCSRDDIRLGAEELGIELEQHFSNVLLALQEFERSKVNENS